MSVSSRSLDRFATTFDHEGLVANAGLILAATLMDRLGLLGLIERWVRTGSANPGRKILTLVAAMLAGATHIDHVEMLRAGGTGRVLGFTPMAPSTVGSFLRTFTFGHARQLEAVLARTLARAHQLVAVELGQLRRNTDRRPRPTRPTRPDRGFSPPNSSTGETGAPNDRLPAHALRRRT